MVLHRPVELAAFIRHVDYSERTVVRCLSAEEPG